jgi:AcrR family transcriptional regulator
MYAPCVNVSATSSEPARRLSREEARARTRERLLDAAADVFKRLGFAGASLDAVAEAAGYTKGAVYSNFATKADLFVALLERVCQAEAAVQAEAFARQSFGEWVDDLDKLFARQVTDDPQWIVLQMEFWLAAVRDPEIREKLLAASAGSSEQTGEAIDRELARAGASSSFTGQELGILMNALATGFAIHLQLEPKSADPRLLVRAVRRLAGLDERREPDERADTQANSAAR